MDKERLCKWKTSTDIVQAIITIIAIGVGGFWTYKNFVEQRQNHIRAQLSQSISDFRIEERHNLLIVDEHLLNLGTRLVSFQTGEIRVIQVLPLPEATRAELAKTGTVPETHTKPSNWKFLHYRQQSWNPKDHIIEPGETEQIHNEFVLPDDVQVVMVLSYVYNPEEASIGWEIVSFYDLRTHTLISGDKVQDSNTSTKSP